MNPEIIGAVAAFLTTAAYIPQVTKVLKEKDTKAISLGMYLMMAAGLATWLAYGVMLGSPSMVAANGVTLTLALVIVAMKIRHG
jgi:MtN3 and saliva related transmembrane protein